MIQVMCVSLSTSITHQFIHSMNRKSFFLPFSCLTLICRVCDLTADCGAIAAGLCVSVRGVCSYSFGMWAHLSASISHAHARITRIYFLPFNHVWALPLYLSSFCRVARHHANRNAIVLAKRNDKNRLDNASVWMRRCCCCSGYSHKKQQSTLTY